MIMKNKWRNWTKWGEKYRGLFWTIALILFVLYQRLPSFKSNTYTPNIILSEKFERQNIGLNVRYSLRFNEQLLRQKQTQQFINQHFATKSSSETLVLGKSYHQSEAWIYFEIINPVASTQKLVVDASHLRCDALQIYTIDEGIPTLTGSIERATPLSERVYPFYEFALPISSPPNDTVRVMLRSSRFTGLHELDLQLSTEKEFKEYALTKNLKNTFTVYWFFAFAVFMLVVGGIFRQKKLIYLGGFLFGLCIIYLNSGYFVDTFPFASQSALGPSNAGSFSIFLTNALFHPFAYQMMIHIPINLRRYRFWAWFLVGCNISMMFLIVAIHASWANIVYTNALQLLIIANMAWALYHAYLAYIRANISYYLLVEAFVFVPPLIELLLRYFRFFNSPSPFSEIFFNASAVILLVAYLALEELKNELILKQNLLERLDQLRQNTEAQRKSEIEAIGRNLHDQVGNTLASALGYLNMKKVNVATAKTQIMNALTELRFISHNLVKDDDRPLSEKVESLISRFNDFSSTNFYFQDYSEKKMDKIPQLTQQNIYNMIEELMTNIIKHAQATEAHIQFFANDSQWQVSIEDDGVGFDTNQTYQGIGLQNIYKRAELSSLRVLIDSTNDGTSVIIETNHAHDSTHY